MKRITPMFAISRFVGTVLVGALTACSNPDAATEEDYDDVAAGMGALTSRGGAEQQAMSDSVVLLRGDVPLGLSLSASGSFEGLHGNLMYSYDLTCRNASGYEMLVCDDTTASGELNVGFNGELNVGSFSGSVEREGEWEVSGLQGEVARFDGAARYEVEADWRNLLGTMRSYRLSYEAEYAAIGFRTADGAPVSGEARFSIEATRMSSRGGNTTEAELTIDAALHFEGDGSATLILDGDRRYAVNLESGAVVRE